PPGVRDEAAPTTAEVDQAEAEAEALAEVEAEAEEELTPDEQLAQARERVVSLPTRGRRKPKAEGVKLPGRRKPPARPAEEEEAEEPVAGEAPAEPVVEAPAPAEPVEAAAPAEPVEAEPVEAEEPVAEEAAAEAAVEAEPVEAEEPVAEEAAAEAAAEAAVEAEPVEAEEPVAEEAPAEAAVEAEPVEAEASEVEAVPETPSERPKRRPIRRRPPRPGPKLARRPAAGPLLAPRPEKPRAHPQKVGAEEAAALPKPHPQAVGTSVGKKQRPPARPKRKKARKGAPVDEQMKAEMETVAKKAPPARRGRRRRDRAEGEQAEGIRRAQAFRRRERTRQREELEEVGAGGDRQPGQPILSERGRRGARRPPGRRGRRPSRPRPAEGPSKATIEAPITVKSLSAAIGIKASDIIKYLMVQGQMATINDALTEEQALEVALSWEMELEVRAERAPAQIIEEIEGRQDAPEALQPRPPVVTFLGHVDHGKTSLMDTIRKTRVAEGEAGGITQHIGAYRVPIGERSVTFLDTPGHEAFTAMRARGARVTDVVVLVVAADDGVMPQTEEAINHARAAEVPIVVAINKCDLPQADPDRVRRQLTQYELLAEEWGGQTICVETSAVTGQNVDQLLESLSLEAEILELRANSDREALGTVIEGELTEGMGPMATLLVQDGSLKAGDVVLAGAAYGKIRVMHDESGREMQEAGPADPIRVAGLSDVPVAGDRFFVLGDLAVAKELADQRRHRLRETELAEQRRPRTLEAVFEQMTEQQVTELAVIIKADVQGSLEALRDNLEKIEHPEVRVRVIHGGVGGINESDVLLADASDAVIIGFNAVPDPTARTLAEARGVDVRQYNVIYHVTEDVRKALEGLLAPEREEHRLGEAEILQTFRVSRVGTIAGCRVTDGTIPRNAQVHVIRDGLVVYDGKIGSLKHFQDDVREARSGQECGLHIDGYDDVKIGDRLEAYEVVSVARTL
ncbi:MAG: translation initiation factor IF-2, partial [Planctomycetota bacterium]|nr:translation initiation factor IF-2 [Planctomycetota bacterium]